MAEPYIGEIRTFAFAGIPTGWLQCNGQSLPSAQNAALYSLLGTQYGGNPTNFNLPDLRGRAPINYGNRDGLTYLVGKAGGADNVVLTTATIPPHTHQACALKDPGTKQYSSANMLATPTPVSGQTTTPANNIYAPAANPLVALNPYSISTAGSDLGHNNMQPSMALNMCIATVGFYPSRQ